MTDFSNTNLFTDHALLADPHPYFDYLRGLGRVVRLPQYGTVATLGYEETLAVFRDDDRFSAVNAPSGPALGLPFTPQGDDITAQIEAHRHEMTFAGLVATQDPPVHTRTRGLMAGVITPRRLRDNEAFLWELADRQIDSFIDKGRFEVASDYGAPFTTQAIADLLGVPASDHIRFTEMMGGGSPVMPGQFEGVETMGHNPLEQLGMVFYQYLSERRAEPRGDVLTQLALATYPDGTLPDLMEVIGIAAFLFGAGQDTTVSLVTAALRRLAEDQDLQARIRADHRLIPDFLEEVLRLDGTVKAVFRLAKVPVRVGDLELAPGTPVMLMIAAANRDPDRFEDPHAFNIGRPNLREHLSFGRGVHACIGSPLARAEAKVTLERLFARIGTFRIDETRHGPAHARRYGFLPTYMFRVMTGLHLEFERLG